MDAPLYFLIANLSLKSPTLWQGPLVFVPLCPASPGMMRGTRLFFLLHGKCRGDSEGAGEVTVHLLLKHGPYIATVSPLKHLPDLFWP